MVQVGLSEHSKDAIGSQKDFDALRPRASKIWFRGIASPGGKGLCMAHSYVAYFSVLVFASQSKLNGGGRGESESIQQKIFSLSIQALEELVPLKVTNDRNCISHVTNNARSDIHLL
jgi:hypothetical protein